MDAALTSIPSETTKETTMRLKKEGGVRQSGESLFWFLLVTSVLALSFWFSYAITHHRESARVPYSALPPMPSQTINKDSLSQHRKITKACYREPYKCRPAETFEYGPDQKFFVIDIPGTTPFGLQLLVAYEDGYDAQNAIWTNPNAKPVVGMPVKLRKTTFGDDPLGTLRLSAY